MKEREQMGEQRKWKIFERRKELKKWKEREVMRRRDSSDLRDLESGKRTKDAGLAPRTPLLHEKLLGIHVQLYCWEKERKKIYTHTHASLLFCWINFDGDGSGSGDVQLVIVVLNNFIGCCSAFTDKDSFPCPTWIQLSVPRETKKDIYVVVLYFFLKILKYNKIDIL